MKVIISVFGQDRVGIIAALTALLAEKQVNVLEVNQTIFHGSFTMLISAAMPEGADFDEVRGALQNAAESLNLTAQMQRQELFDAMHKL